MNIALREARIAQETLELESRDRLRCDTDVERRPGGDQP